MDTMRSCTSGRWRKNRLTDIIQRDTSFKGTDHSKGQTKHSKGQTNQHYSAREGTAIACPLGIQRDRLTSITARGKEPRSRALWVLEIAICSANYW